MENPMLTNGKYAFKIAPDAAQYIAEHGVEKTFQQLMDNIPQRFAGVRAIEVSLQNLVDDPEDYRVIFDVALDHPGTNYDPNGWAWICWVAETFPGEQSQHFCVLPNYGPAHAR